VFLLQLGFQHLMGHVKLPRLGGPAQQCGKLLKLGCRQLSCVLSG
jgi:hypothetical protein